MARGRKCGDERRLLSVRLFVRDEGGYTTVAIAVALLVSLTLVFGMAAAEWSTSRAADVQEVADATALAGSNAVAGFSTIAQVTDAIVLSMGLTGMATLGAGLVLSAIPFAQAGAPEVIDAGTKVLKMRNDFAHEAAAGMQRLEVALPAIVMANASSCVSANCQGGMEYVGTAVPFPLKSQTDYSFLDQEVSGDELARDADELQEAAQRKEDAIERAKEAKERAWHADCVDDPKCLRSRAATLAGLSGAANPNYATPDEWLFGYARTRALSYYRLRLGKERMHGRSAKEMTRVATRKRFYRYAADQIGQSTCEEGGEVPVIDLPELPHTVDMVKATELYSERIWPCTQEEGGRTLHSSLACPGAKGDAAGQASLAQVDSGSVRRCEKCQLDVFDMGEVAHASTNINNGFEHYWQAIVEASRDYTKAKQDEAQAEQDLQERSDRAAGAFDEAIKQLGVKRPDFVPAGAWGCVAVVRRGGGVATPSELTSAFSPGAELPPGMAISAATLAPEEATDGTNVLSQVWSGLAEGGGYGLGDMADDVCGLWGKLLVDYGSAYGAASEHVDGFLDGYGGVFGERAAERLKKRISGAVEGAGFAPADMRARKPVLVHSQEVLDKAGEGREALGVAREVLAQLPNDGPGAVQTLAREVSNQLGGPTFTVATITVPGTPVEIPLTIDLSTLLGGG